MELKKSDSHYFFIDVLLNEKGIYSKGLFGSKEEQLFFQGDYVDSVVHVIQALLLKNRIFLSHVKKIFPHNVNIFSWKKNDTFNLTKFIMNKLLTNKKRN